MKKDKRKIEVWKDGSWVEATMQDVKKHTRFRMFEDDGVPVKDNEGFVHFVALEDSVVKNGIGAVEAVGLE